MRPKFNQRKIIIFISTFLALTFFFNCEKKQTNQSGLFTSLFYATPPTNSLDPITSPIQDGAEIQASIVVEKIRSGEYQINPGGQQEGKVGILGSYTNLPNADIIYRNAVPSIGKIIPN